MTLPQVAVKWILALIDNGKLLQHDVVDRIYNRPASIAVAHMMGGKNSVFGIVSNGIHHSPIGRVALGEETPDGPGTLFIRQVAIGVPTASPASGSGSIQTHAGVVSALQHTGPRRSVVIDANGIDIHAELAAGIEIAVGKTVNCRVYDAARGCVRRTSVRPDGRTVISVDFAANGSNLCKPTFSTGSKTECCTHAGTRLPSSG